MAVRDCQLYVLVDTTGEELRLPAAAGGRRGQEITAWLTAAREEPAAAPAQ